MPWWEDDGREEEGYIRRLSVAEMLRRVAPRLRPYRRSLLLALALMLISVAAELASPLILRHLIDHDIPESAKSGRITAILRSAGLYLAVFLAGIWAGFWQTIAVARMGLKMVTKLKHDVFSHLLTQGLDYFDQHPPGQLLARTESDAERLQSLFSESALAVLRVILMLAGTLTVMLLADWRVTVAVIGFAAPILTLSFFFLRYMRRLYASLRRFWARVSTFVTEYVQAVPILQVFGRTGWAMDKLYAANRERYLAETKAGFIEYGFWGFFYTMEVLAVMLILWVGFGARVGQGMSLGNLVLFVEYGRRLFFPILMFAEMFNFLQRSFASADRVFGILATRSAVSDPPEALPEIPREWNEIAFEHVTFRYGSGDGPPALDDLSFTLRRGERIALAGPSGGGKTTVTSLLLRFYEPTAGRITLDGIDIRRYSLKAWRAGIGLVLQDIHLFPGTVADNLRVFSDEIPEPSLVRAVEAIGAEDVVAKLPAQLKTSLAQGGQNLSMGERQLISFARAVVRDPQVLVLDEATSSVDPGTERRLQESLRRLMRNRSSLVVAHRLSTITSADRILVLQRGRLVEEGSHGELYARRGLYRGLFDLQFAAGEVV